MNTFLVIATIMVAIAAGAVALPLLRDNASRAVGVVVVLIVIGSSAGLYRLWSNWNWHEPAQSQANVGPDVTAMVAKLEQRLRDQPNDLAGWLMLGRSYVATNRLEDAIVAYDHAHQLDSNNAEAAMGLAEAMSLQAGGDITPQAAQLFEQAVALAPTNPKALLYGGFAAAVRGDRALARSRWQTLKNLNPPEPIVKMLDARIAELGTPDGNLSGAAPAPSNAPPPETGGSAGDASVAQVAVDIAIAPALRARLVKEVPLFVFAREPGSQGPPLAVKRLTSRAIGTQVRLSAADSMLPGRVLARGQRVSITARISFSGQPTPSAGDLYGELSYDVGHDTVGKVIIDRIAE